jgi:endonuclease/exonuclease/phosphatase (EEP) superfamily protein YafD
VPNLHLRFSIKGRTMNCFFVHPEPPMSESGRQYADQQIQRTSQDVKQSEGEVLVAGDFNAAPWSPVMQRLQAETGLRYRVPSGIWRPTWSVGSILTLPLDYGLCSEGCRIIRRDLGPELGSDHRAQILDVALVAK